MAEVLRSYSAHSRYHIRDANTDVCPDLGCLVRGGEEIYLRPATFKTLLLLLEQRHRVVSKDEIEEHVWSGTPVSGDAVGECIAQIRKALGRDPTQTKYVRTLSTKGYRFVGTVQLPDELAARAAVRAMVAAAAQPSTAAVPEPAPPRRSEALTIAVSVVVTALIVAGVTYSATRHDGAASVFLDSRPFTSQIGQALEYVSLRPNEANAFDSLGLSLQNAGRYDEAVTAYGHALELDAKFNVATLHVGNAYVQSGRYDEAMAAYRQYVKQGTTDFESRRGLRNMAIVDLLRGRLSDALAFVRQADAGEPMSIIEARIRLAMGEPADLISSLVQPPPDGPDDGSQPSEREWRDMQGQLALKSGAVDEAIAHFRAGVADRPIGTNPEPLEDILANAYLRLGRYDEAITEYDRILRLNPRYPLVHYHLGQAFEGKHQPALARWAYEQFLSTWAKADRDTPEIVKARQRVAALQ